MSGCINMSVKATTTSAAALKIVSPNNLTMVVKASYNNVASYFHDVSYMTELVSVGNGVLLGVT